jgi:hypothetical protein
MARWLVPLEYYGYFNISRGDLDRAKIVICEKCILLVFTNEDLRQHMWDI